MIISYEIYKMATFDVNESNLVRILYKYGNIDKSKKKKEMTGTLSLPEIVSRVV